MPTPKIFILNCFLLSFYTSKTHHLYHSLQVIVETFLAYLKGRRVLTYSLGPVVAQFYPDDSLSRCPRHQAGAELQSSTLLPRVIYLRGICEGMVKLCVKVLETREQLKQQQQQTNNPPNTPRSLSFCALMPSALRTPVFERC